jgi:hypothetical protein
MTEEEGSQNANQRVLGCEIFKVPGRGEECR